MNSNQNQHQAMSLEIDIPILKSLVLDHCWVCKRKFISHGGTDPSVILNTHHIVPQANGGENGPTVTLCSAHHDLLHAVAVQILAHAPPAEVAASFLDNLPALQHTRICYLSGVVVQSTLAVAADPNKKAKYTVDLSGAERKMVMELAKYRRLSISALLRNLVREEHTRLFPTIPSPSKSR